MTADTRGFVQEHECMAVEGTLYQAIDTWLTEIYGARKSVRQGLRWLTGNGVELKAWMDHPEYRVKDGKRTFIGRPYQLDLEQVECMVNLAKEKGLKLLITCPSNYNLDTVLVILSQAY